MSATDTDPNEQWVHTGTGEIVTPDAVDPEGVRPEPALPAVPDPSEVAMDRAAEQALTMPGFAARDEFMMMCLKARMIAMSELAPKDLRGKPYNVLMVLMKGRALGIDEATALEDVYVIEGKTSVAPRLQVGLIQRMGLGDVVPHPANSRTWAAAVPLGPNGQPIGEPVVFDWDDALDAELVDPTCGPDPDRPGRISHNIRQMQRGRSGNQRTVRSCGCKDNYRKHGDDMLYWRAVAKCVRRYFSQVGLGAYQPDELGAVTDDQGNPIDVNSVELPPGYEDAEGEKEARRAEAVAQAEAPADAGERAELRERIARLPEGIQTRLREAWNAEDCNVRGFSLRDEAERVLPATKLRIAKALVNAWEGTARKEGWDPDAQPAAPAETAEAPQQSEEPAGPQPAPDTPGEAPEAGSDDQGAPDGAAGGGLPDNPEFDVDAPDDEPAFERKDGAPEPDWKAQMSGLAERVRKACEGVPDQVIARIALQVKELHWAKVNEELDDAGVPRDGAPIDLRRMHVSLLRLRAFRSAQGMDDVTAPGQPPNPVLQPREGETPF